MSLYDVKTGKKLKDIYDIKTGKKLSKVYQFTPTGYSLVYQALRKLWETKPEAYQLLNLQTDSTGNLYSVLSGLGFHRLQASDGSTLDTGSEPSLIVGDLNIDETNAVITYITSNNNWNKFKYSGLSKLVYGKSKSSDSVIDSVPLTYPINSYKSTIAKFNTSYYDVLDNSSTTAVTWPKKKCLFCTGRICYGFRWIQSKLKFCPGNSTGLFSRHCKGILRSYRKCLHN